MCEGMDMIFLHTSMVPFLGLLFSSLSRRGTLERDFEKGLQKGKKEVTPLAHSATKKE